MEDWIILAKFFTLVYVSVKFSTSNMENVTYVILFALAYVCINMLFYILKNNFINNTCLIISILLIIVCSININPLFILLLPLNILELVYRVKYNLWISIISLSIVLALTNRTLVPEYILTTLLCFLVFQLSIKHFNRIGAMNKELDTLRESNYSLNEKLTRDSEYERQVKYSSQLEERNKIAQEIHDRIGHSISGSLMQLEAAKLLINNDPKKAEGMLQNVINILREGMESIRATLRNIKPAPEQLGINRTKLLLDEFSLNSHIKTNLFFKGNLERITHIQWKVIYENVKESLTNSSKYSKCTVITVNIEVLNKLIKAEVSDNGIGAINIKKGLGIAGIEERSENSGGKVIYDGSNGFSIITLLPVE